MPSHQIRVKQANCDHHKFYHKNGHYWTYPIDSPAAVKRLLEEDAKCAYCEIKLSKLISHEASPQKASQSSSQHLNAEN